MPKSGPVFGKQQSTDVNSQPHVTLGDLTMSEQINKCRDIQDLFLYEHLQLKKKGKVDSHTQHVNGINIPKY